MPNWTGGRLSSYFAYHSPDFNVAESISVSVCTDCTVCTVPLFTVQSSVYSCYCVGIICCV